MNLHNFVTGFWFAVGAVVAVFSCYVLARTVNGWFVFVLKTIADVQHYREEQEQEWRQPWERTIPDAWRYTWLARRINLRTAARASRSR